MDKQEIKLELLRLAHASKTASMICPITAEDIVAHALVLERFVLGTAASEPNVGTSEDREFTMHRGATQ